MENKKGFADKYFLEKIYLSGYKSIQQTEIELKSNFNIIIGKNGAGKTNFMEFLNKSLNYNLNHNYNFTSILHFHGIKEIEVIIENKLPENIFKEKGFIKDDAYIFKAVINNNSEKTDDFITQRYSELYKRLEKENFFSSSTLIQHGVPITYNIVDNPFTFSIDIFGRPLSLLSDILHENSFFIKSILSFFLYRDENPGFLKTIRTSVEEVKNQIEKYLINCVYKIDLYLKNFSPIDKVRFNKGYNVFQDDEKKVITVSNLFLEFEINGSWYPFSNLSDGTKRLIYIISEVAYPDFFAFQVSTFGKSKESYSRIILIEEPELGIHPHQFHNLMTFLKEQSQTKQIIITTHSPEALNILSADELDSIILSEYDKEKGTLLRHMTDKEKMHAKSYIKDMYLSDYWMHSNLEPAN